MRKINSILIFLFVFNATTYCSIFNIKEKNPMTELIKQECTNVTGNPDYYLNVTDAMKTATSCLYTLVNETLVQMEIKKFIPFGLVNDIFNRTCRKQDEMIECINIENNVYTQCLTKDRINDRKKFMKVVKRSLSYICSEDGQLISRFIENEGQSCFRDNSDKIEKCISSVFPDFQNQLALSNFITQQNCGKFQEIKNCVIPTIKSCRKEAIQIAENFIDTIMNELECDNIRNVTTQINLNFNLLLFILISILLRKIL